MSEAARFQRHLDIDAEAGPVEPLAVASGLSRQRVKQVMRQMADARDAAPFDFYEEPVDDHGNIIKLREVNEIDLTKHRLARRINGATGRHTYMTRT